MLPLLVPSSWTILSLGLQTLPSRCQHYAYKYERIQITSISPRKILFFSAYVSCAKNCKCCFKVVHFILYSYTYLQFSQCLSVSFLSLIKSSTIVNCLQQSFSIDYLSFTHSDLKTECNPVITECNPIITCKPYLKQPILLAV